MKRRRVLTVLAAPLVTFSIDTGLFAPSATSLWRPSIAFAQADDVSAKKAFEAARTLDTPQAWDAFLMSYPTGFYDDLARASIKKLHDGSAAATPAPATPP